MARIAFKMRLKPGCEAIYKEKHDNISPATPQRAHKHRHLTRTRD